MTTSYRLSDFVRDLLEAAAGTDESAKIVSRVRPLAKRLSLSKDWIEPRFWEADEKQGFGVYLLHEEADHSLAVYAVSWLPGRGAPPHNHGTWAVVAGVDGTETNVFWKRLDDGARPGFASLTEESRRGFGAGEVVCFLPNEIHAVVNEEARTTLSLHVYGYNLNHTGRSQFDPERGTETPFMISVR